jgi:hypothetical protein
VARGLTATRAGQTANPCSRVVQSPEVAGLAANLYIVYGMTTTEACQTANSSNGQNLKLKVVVAIVTIWLRIELRYDRQVHRIFSTTSFWSVCYTYSSISCKMTLLAIWIAYLILESTLPLHTSIPWSIVGVWDSSAWFEWVELCGTRDSSSKRHRLVTLRGCRLLDGLEEWKPWALEEDCECGPVFLWEVLCSPRQSSEEQL